MSSKDIAIHVSNPGKCYEIYNCGTLSPTSGTMEPISHNPYLRALNNDCFSGMKTLNKAGKNG
jgi:hypothetical protein